jgi:hypothetical protein
VISTHLSNPEDLAEVAAAEKAEKQDAKEALEAAKMLVSKNDSKAEK